MLQSFKMGEQKDMETKARYKINKLLRKMDSSNRREGYIKIYSNNSWEHTETMFQIAYKLKKEGFLVYSECKFINGKRADLIVFSPSGEGTIIEILHSESKERFNQKLNDYPIDFEIMAVSTKDFDINKFNL